MIDKNSFTLPHRKVVTGMSTSCIICNDYMSWSMHSREPDEMARADILQKRHTVDGDEQHMWQSEAGNPEAPCEHCGQSRDSIRHLDFRRWDEVIHKLDEKLYIPNPYEALADRREAEISLEIQDHARWAKKSEISALVSAEVTKQKNEIIKAALKERRHTGIFNYPLTSIYWFCAGAFATFVIASIFN